MWPYLKVVFHLNQTWFMDRSSFCLKAIRLSDSFFGVESDSINRFENPKPMHRINRYSDFESDSATFVWYVRQYRTIRYDKTPPVEFKHNIEFDCCCIRSLFIDFNILLFREIILMFHGVFQIEYHYMFCTEKLHLLYNLTLHPIVDCICSDTSCIVTAAVWNWNNTHL